MPPTVDNGPTMIQGLRTVIYHVGDLSEAKTWYTRLLEQEPYFDQPFYVGYSVGGFELGLIPDGAAGAGGPRAPPGGAKAAAARGRARNPGAKIKERAPEGGGGRQGGRRPWSGSKALELKSRKRSRMLEMASRWRR